MSVCYQDISGSNLATMSRFGLSPGVSFFIREKDIGFDLSGIKGYQRVRTDELIIFAKDKLNLKPSDIRSIQVHPVGPYAFIGFNNVERMRDVYDGIKEGVVWPGKGEVFPFLCTESYTEVKLKGLEPGTDVDTVKLLMEQYGNILSCKEYLARIPAMKADEGFPTGDFSLRIQLATRIPRYLPQAREGNVWLATYEGQDDECWRCWESGHEKRDCKSKPYAPGFIKDQRHYRDLHLRGGDSHGGGVVEKEGETGGVTGVVPPGLVASQVVVFGGGNEGGVKEVEKEGLKAGSSPLGESSPPSQVASLGEVEGDKTGSSPLGESNPPCQVASLGVGEQVREAGSAPGGVPPCLVASQVVGGGDIGIEANNDLNLDSLFPPGNTQELNVAMDDFENEDAFGVDNSQVCLDALDKAEAGPSGTKPKPKTVRARSWSTDETSPKRLIHKPLGLESDLRKGLTDWTRPLITPQDRLAFKNIKKDSILAIKTAKKGSS